MPERDFPGTGTGTGSGSGSGAEVSVSLESVTRRFNPEVLGLDDVSLEFRKGEVAVLLGLSGSGKSTLLRHVNGLQRPNSGKVTVLGHRMETAGARELRVARREIGFVFQDFNLVGSMSVLENVCTGRLGSLRGPRLSLMMYPRSVRRDALEQLDRVGLADRAHQRADTLSGGQQQRVAIARTLIQKPKILLADEPVASLDPRSSSQVIQLIARIAREEALTVICSLHQVELALSFADRIIGLRTGQVVMDRRAAGIDPSEALMIYERVSATDLSGVALARPSTV